VVVAVLAIGIGANTALVTIIDAIVKRPPPGVRDAGDLVRLSLRREDPFGRGLTWEQFLRFQDRRDLFTAVAVARPVTVALQTADATETRPAVLASSEYFAVLRPRLVLGTGLPRNHDSVVTIVGLVGAVRRSAVSSGTDPVVYLSWRQLPLRNLATFESQRSADLREVRPVMLVAYLGAALVLALACLGGYALLAFTVAQGAREIAIRMALGARSTQVGGLIVRQGVRLALVSLVTGLPLALAARLAVQETLGDVEIVTRNVLAVGGVAGLLVLTAAAASWLPARRAAAVDPFSQLREE
jgi:hypothetical protein